MRFRSGILYVSVLALGTVLTPLSVQAGFEWVAPKEDMSAGMELPVPKPGTPRIAPDPMGLDPLPPLSVDQESGTRATVYAPAPAAPAAAPTASIPRRAMPPAVSEMAPREMEAAPRMRTLQMGAGQNQNNRMAGSVSVPVYDDPNQPKRLRMSEQLVVPPDVEIEAEAPQSTTAAEGQTAAINPAPLAAPAPHYQPVPRPSMIQPAPAPAMDVPVNNASVLEGFGSDIPLVMALQQIVPPEYTYSFASGVNPGESVSWEGGKSWAQVLSEMLSQEGLRASITGKSIQIREGLYDQRADASLAAPSAEDLAATMPAAGAEEPEKPIATPVEKVEAVPPVTPPEILAQAPKGPTRVLGRISENGGLQVQEIKETVQIQGSPEAAARARHDVTERALGLEDASAEVVPEAPLAKITSFSVTKTEHKVAGEVPAVKAAAPVPASAQSAVRRHNITDPGEKTSHQPEVQALNLKAAKSEVAPAEKPQAQAAPVKLDMASVEPQKVEMPSGSVSRSLSEADQRQKLIDMARQQGVTLDAKNYNTDILGKIFNNGVEPAAGDVKEESSSVPAPDVNKPSAIPPESRFWEAGKNDDLKKVLAGWSKDSGVTLVWKAGQDYAVGSNVMVHGGFNDAIKTLFAEGAKSGNFPVMRLNDGGSGKGVLIIEDKS